jgi:hypothetical protein
MASFLRRYYDGGGATTSLQTSMGAADTSFVLTAATGWPGSPANDFGVVIDRGNASEEKILCSSNSGTTVTVVTRGYDGTSATTHSAAATVSLCALALDFDEANQVTHLMGNLATGSLAIGAGAGTIPTALAVGTAASVLIGGTSPTYVAGSNGQYFGVSGGAVTALSLTIPTVLTPVISAISLSATNGSLVEATASITVTSPAVVAGNKFGAFANYAATNASPVTVTAVGGYLIGPGIPASTSSILLGTPHANISFACDGTNWILTSGAQDSGWITPTLGNSWVTSTYTPMYRIVGNRVILRGDLSGGTNGTTAWTMPSGYRPVQYVQFAAFGPGATVNGVQVTSAGLVQPLFASASTTPLDVVSYTVD